MRPSNRSDKATGDAAGVIRRVRRRDVLTKSGALGVMALPGSSGGKVEPLARPSTVASLTELRAASPAPGLLVYRGGVYRWSVGDYSQPPLGPADDYTVISQVDRPIGEGAWVRQGPTISPTSFGAVPGAGTDPSQNARAFRQAIAAAATAGLPLELDGGSYVLDASEGINFAHANLRIVGNGSTLVFAGKGRGFVLDRPGEDGAFLEGMEVENLVIVGNDGITDGFYSRGVVRSSFRNIEVRTVGGKAFHLRHAVSNQYDNLKYSPSQSESVTATHGLFVDNNGAGFYSANCVFTNTIMEDFPGIGCHLTDASGLLFNGGTFEGCDTGLIISPSSSDNLFIKLWAEANRSADVIVAGNRNGFVGGRFMSPSEGPNVQVRQDAQGTWFNGGGYIRSVHISPGSRETSFIQVGIDENLTGTVGFQGNGPFTRMGCVKVNDKNLVVGAYDDRLGALEAIGGRGTWAPALRSQHGSIEMRADLTHGSYQRVGDLVFAQCFLSVLNVRQPDGDLFIEGLPFPSAGRQPAVVHATHLRRGLDSLQGRVDPNERTIGLSRLLDGAAKPCAEYIQGDTTLSISMTYLTFG